MTATNVGHRTVQAMNPKVDDYITNVNDDWQREVVIALRNLVHEADPEIQETMKWGTPTFEHNGIAAWLFCAKDWVHFSFPQGALLDSSHNLFEPTENKAQRTIKIKKDTKLPHKVIIQLVKQAVENNLTGKRVNFTPEPHRPIVLPDDMLIEMRAYGLEEAYEARPYYQQKGYIQWIDQAKHDATRQKRITKMIEELQEGSYMPPKRSKM